MAAVATIAVAAVIVGTRGDTATSERAGATASALPPGPPTIQAGSAVGGRATVPDLIREADVVFVGRVTEVGGSEVVSPAAAEGVALTRHRVRFDVTETLFGSPGATIDISLLDIEEVSYPFEVGREYLVFGWETTLGSSRTPATVPLGYGQGVFVRDGGSATNEINGRIEIETVARLMKERPNG